MSEAPRDSAASRDPVSLVVGAIAAQVIGGLVTQMSPLMIGGYMQGLALSERDAGSIASVEFLALAVTGIAIAPLLPRLSNRGVGLGAVALALLAQAASIFSTSLASLALLRGLAGIGEGVLYAVSLSIIASRSRNPDKVYGYFQLAWAVGSVVLFSVGGHLTAAFAHRGILGLIVAVTLVLAPFLLFIPSARGRRADEAVAHAPPSMLLGVMTLAAIALYLTASAALYAFSAPLGERAGLDAAAVGYALTAGTLVGLAGAGAATVVNVRWGRAIPISGFSIGFAVVALMLCLTRDPTAYVFCIVASCVIFYFSMPYLFGLAAALDGRGRWAAAAGSGYLIGFAIGPVAAGSVIGAAGYAGLAALCVATSAAAWGLAMIVNRRLGGTSRAASAAPV